MSSGVNKKDSPPVYHLEDDQQLHLSPLTFSKLQVIEPPERRVSEPALPSASSSSAAKSASNMAHVGQSSNSLSVPSLPRHRANSGSRESVVLQPIVYSLMYFGNVVLDRRITQPMLPWLIDEKQRNGRLGHAIILQISSKGALGISERKGSIVFEHRLHNISRFSRGHDKKCFGYLWRPDPNSNFRCFVFRACSDQHDQVVSGFFFFFLI